MNQAAAFPPTRAARRRIAADQKASDQAWRLVAEPAASRQPTLGELRRGPPGQDLLRLAMVARGQLREPRKLMLTAIDAVLQLLFWPVGPEDYAVPQGFGDTTLGRLLVRAKARAVAAAEPVGIDEAARQVGATRPNRLPLDRRPRRRRVASAPIG